MYNIKITPLPCSNYWKEMQTTQELLLIQSKAIQYKLKHTRTHVTRALFKIIVLKTNYD